MFATEYIEDMIVAQGVLKVDNRVVVNTLVIFWVNLSTVVSTRSQLAIVEIVVPAVVRFGNATVGELDDVVVFDRVGVVEFAVISCTISFV